MLEESPEAFPHHPFPSSAAVEPCSPSSEHSITEESESAHVARDPEVAEMPAQLRSERRLLLPEGIVPVLAAPEPDPTK